MYLLNMLGILGTVLLFMFWGDIIQVIQHQLDKWKQN
jgi:hypothetical protein